MLDTGRRTCNFRPSAMATEALAIGDARVNDAGPGGDTGYHFGTGGDGDTGLTGDIGKRHRTTWLHVNGGLDETPHDTSEPRLSVTEMSTSMLLKHVATSGLKNTRLLTFHKVQVRTGTLCSIRRKRFDTNARAQRHQQEQQCATDREEPDQPERLPAGLPREARHSALRWRTTWQAPALTDDASWS